METGQRYLRGAKYARDFSIAPHLPHLNLLGKKSEALSAFLDAHISTCLDSAVLMAACFEQAGLNSVVAFKEGHAWVGVWLIDSCFSVPIIDCVQSVRKRVDSGELLMLEATAVTQSLRPSMQLAARTKANSYLEEEVQ